MKNTILLGLAIFLISCTPQKAQNEFTYWINSYKVDCTGVGPQSCLLIQKSETIEENEWQNFYSKIDGFDFEPGYIYKLKVKEEKRENVPADASSIKFTLVEVLEKKKDERFAINDIWVAEEIDGKTVKMDGNAPQMEIHIAKMEIMGTDGCNNFRGRITRLTNDDLELGPLAGTRMMCPKMTIPDSFNIAMSRVKSYKIANLKLTLFDKAGKELIVFKKID